jgi:signal transduction histidine kinase
VDNTICKSLSSFPVIGRLRRASARWQSDRQISNLRKCVARRINADVVGDLSEILVKLRSSAHRVRHVPRLFSHLQLAIAAAEEGLAQARQLVGQLSTSAFNQAPTSPRILIRTVLIEELEQALSRSSIAFVFQGATDLALPWPLAHEVPKIAREVATNAAKHSVARSTVLFVRVEGNSLMLQIRDDSVCFASTSSSKGFGILGLVERSQSICARLCLTSSLGEGTSLSLECPLGPGPDTNVNTPVKKDVWKEEICGRTRPSLF